MRKGFAQATEENSRQPDYGRDWGPWKEWDGVGTFGPDDDDLYDEPFVQVHRRSPNSDRYLVMEAHHVDWAHQGTIDDILAYRVET